MKWFIGMILLMAVIQLSGPGITFRYEQDGVKHDIKFSLLGVEDSPAVPEAGGTYKPQ